MRKFFSPDAEGSEGSNPTPKTFSQEQVEQMIAGRTAKLQQESSETVKRLAELQARLDELSKPKEPEPQASDLEGRLKLLEKRHTEETARLQAQLNQSQEREKQEAERRKKMELTNALTEALLAAGCRQDALQIATAHFSGRIQEDDDGFIYSLSGGGTVSLKEGVAAELPDYMKEPIVRGGGSGSKASTKAQAQKQRIAEAEAEVEKLRKIAESTRTDAAVVNYTKAKKTLAALQAQQNS